MIRIALSWAFYWSGDLVCRTIVNRTLGHWFEWPYRFYSWLMRTALALQGDDPRGPWLPAEPSDSY